METNKDIIDFMKPRKREEVDNSYFEGLVSNAIASAKKPEVKKIVPLYKRTVFWFSGAAAVILVFIAIRLFHQTSVIDCDFNSVSKSELLAYINDNIEDFDQDLLIEYVPVESKANPNEMMFPVETLHATSSSNDDPNDDPNDHSNGHPNNKSQQKDLFQEINKEDILEYMNEQELMIEDLQESADIY